VRRVLEAARDVIVTEIEELWSEDWIRHFGDRAAVLLGDAAHAMTPNLGQGACQAIEDAVVLSAYAGRPGGLALYSAVRVPRTAAVAATSRRIGRLTQISNPVAVWARDTAMRLAGRLGPNLVLRQMDPILSWRPPDVSR